MNIISEYFSLTPPEKQFLTSKQITDEKTADQWLQFFAKIRSFDFKNDKNRNRSFWVGCLGLILIFVSFFLMTVIIGFVILPMGLLMLIGGLIFYFFFKKFDVDSEVLKKSVIPLIKVLKEEMSPQAKLKMRLDVRGFQQNEKLLRQSNPYNRGAYYKIVDSFYKDQWFDGETYFADGTKIIWSIENFVKNSTKSKQNPRGKTKTKTKAKHRSIINLQAAVLKKNYRYPPRLKEKNNQQAILTRSTKDHDWIKIRKSVKHPVGNTFTVVDFIHTVAVVYQKATQMRGR